MKLNIVVRMIEEPLVKPDGRQLRNTGIGRKHR